MVDDIVKALDICLGNGHCVDCYYRTRGASTGNCRDRLLYDAKSMLIEQQEQIERLRGVAQGMMEGLVIMKK